MKDLSMFLLKNSFGAKMIKKGFKNFCNNESSTSTLNQQIKSGGGGGADPGGSSTCTTVERPVFNSPVGETRPGPATLEEMIAQIEMEEKMMSSAAARKGRRSSGGIERHRMSCVNSSDILRTARNALNQYPRFSLDGKDAMYRSSFAAPMRGGREYDDDGKAAAGGQGLPDVVGGESVVWCKPGVVGKLMGLDAIPVPLNCRYRRERLSAIIRRRNLRKRGERSEIERRRAVGLKNAGVGSCSRTGYCFVNPMDMDVGLRR
ncbi:uncharacterized protein LOC127241445 [Andrographis paniculata]|uniref:uncharacterized protein LOC127241445 n=1 Tax=Andrographis paniculata TaxID=175694 RepID=UPI0021E8ED06|nr:uncharacterized protein LOC127241445 [Andrographis paniculata]